jgi:hypothetical protein
LAKIRLQLQQGSPLANLKYRGLCMCVCVYVCVCVCVCVGVCMC